MHRGSARASASSVSTFDPRSMSRLLTRSPLLSSPPGCAATAAAAARPRAMHRRAAASCTQVRNAHRRALISSRSTPDDARRRAQASPTWEGATEVRRTNPPETEERTAALTTRAVSFAHTRETHTTDAGERHGELFRTPPPATRHRRRRRRRHARQHFCATRTACVRAYCSSLFSTSRPMMAGESGKSIELTTDPSSFTSLDSAEKRPDHTLRPIVTLCRSTDQSASSSRT